MPKRARTESNMDSQATFLSSGGYSLGGGSRASRKSRRVSQRLYRRGMKSLKKNVPAGIYTFVRSKFTQAVLTLGTGDVFRGMNFKLVDMPNASEFTVLFDQYRIRSIKVTLIPRATDYVANASVPSTNLLSAIDYDDSAAPASFDVLTQYQNMKMTRTHESHTRIFKPKVSDEVYQTGVTTGYAPKANQWIDCNSDQVEHYGLKYGIQGMPGTTNNIVWDMMVTYVVDFKNVR